MDTNLPHKDSFQLEDYRDILWTCQMCTCGFCMFECQAYKLTGLEAAGARGRNHIALGILNGELGLDDLPDLLLYACTTCRYCEEVCAQNMPLSVKERHQVISGATTSELLRNMKVAAGKIPPQLRDVFKSFVKYGNPYGISERNKDTWVEGLGLKPMDIQDKEAILYVGAMVPFEEKSTKAAEALYGILSKAGLNLGMIGSKELSSGGLVRPMGEEGLFEYFVDHCSALFKDNGVKRVICFSPHDLDAFRTYYSDLGIEFEHYTETLSRLIEDKAIQIKKEYQKTVTYQDPCYLGRRSKIYDPPRKILDNIPGITFIEMDKIKNDSHCCGGGGVGLWLDFEGLRMDLQRADDARESGAQVIATACPACLQMLDSAVKARGFDLEVKDLAQILQEII